MKSRRYRRQRKQALMILCLMLVVAIISVSGTIAWLTSTPQTVINTFTPATIDVDISEDATDFTMVPGCTIEKDPKVLISKESADGWLFVEITEYANLDSYIAYEVADGWKPVPGQTNVYYYDLPIVKGQEISVLKDDQVTVLTTVTKQMMETAKTNKPTLTFQAYVCQKAEVADAATAWGYITAS